MRRLASLLAGGALFLLIGAIPALADGGPHSAATNTGSAGINADSCAGCHRAHTASAPLLLKADESDLCLTCHGGTGSGATADVMNGVQYKAGETHGTGAILGALRAGGYENARIDTANAGRLTYTRRSGNGTTTPYTYPTTQAAVVPVRSAGQATTSRHFDPENPLAAIVWGSGAISASDFAGSSITLECTSCHNPHGNGQYRILNPIPGDHDGAFPEAAAEVAVTDVLDPARIHNYTVIQQRSTTATYSNGSVTAEGAESGYLLYADQVDGTYANTVGDYFHRMVPWNGTTDYTDQAAAGDPGVPPVIVDRMNDAPNGHPLTFDGQINSWCSQCHTRYLATGTRPYETDSGDGIFTYRHSNTSNKPCTTCHVAHGSNAQMGGDFSSVFPYPNSTDAVPNLSASSRLLKFDNRGTCSACHDPTDTVPAGTWYPTAVPTPVVP